MITLHRLTKRYGSLTVVDRIGFEVPPGTVTGFLGPNGAGKSTALRMLVGLTTPTSGQATILGRPYAELANPGREVGVLLDASALHPGRTGLETLRLGALTMGLDRSRVEQVLAVVGLTETEARRRVRHYSLGMRQRLGLAHALLGDPQVLVLDEPANGLDPAGIHWMRRLLRDFAGRGGTVLISSHLIAEIELVADHIVMIGHGRIVASTPTADLRQTARTSVTAEDPAALAAALRYAGLVVEPGPGATLVVTAEPAVVGRVARDAHLTLTALHAEAGIGLEATFLALTANHARQETAA